MSCGQLSAECLPARPSTLENRRKLARAGAVCMPPAGVWVHVAFAMVSGKHVPFVELVWFKHCA